MLSSRESVKVRWGRKQDPSDRLEVLQRLVVETFGVPRDDLGRERRERAVDRDPDPRAGAVAIEARERVQDVLRPADREGRDQEPPAPAFGEALHRRRELAVELLVRRVEAIP
jgi:hypothetical protein